jgi:hypothetical protein
MDSEAQVPGDCRRLGIGIVVYGAARELERCILSIRRSGFEGKICLFDNGVEIDEPVPPHILREYGSISLLSSTRNVGFGCGVNSLAVNLDTDNVWILNPDAVVNKDTVERSLSFAGAGVLSHSLRALGSRTEEMSHGRYSLWLGRIQDQWPVSRFHWPFVCGASFVCDRSLLLEHPMCTCCFMYFEDVEWSKRAVKSVSVGGWVEHDPGATRGGPHRLPNPFFLYYSSRNRVYISQRLTQPHRSAASIGVCVEFLRLCSLVFGRSRSLRATGTAIRESFNGIRDGLRMVPNDDCPIHA